VRGRRIVAYRLGTGPAATRYLVLGGMHGDEPAGAQVVAGRLLAATPPPGVEVWVIPTMNPDGFARATRTNARGVDLNRNFPSQDWLLQGRGTSTYSGPRAASEPETRAMLRFLDDVRPATIVSLHQPLRCVDFSGGDPEVTYWLARHLGLPARQLGVSGGNMTGWYNRRFPQRTAVTLELMQPAPVRFRNRLSEVLLDHAAARARQLTR